MSLRKVLVTIVFFSLFAADAASASLISNDIAAARDDGASAPSAVASVRRDFPIVMGRSVSVRHKTKLHHIKMKPVDPIETPAEPQAE
ncbi:hypothetical protein [Methylocapsa acidiphila]|uniref:hypothetical protein n=1 Tax=Methylocapsa acidiphila TaxID=133552 RepID=UPI0003FA379E|nr:hypothetical protein [Methylocapsa acidiphila]